MFRKGFIKSITGLLTILLFSALPVTAKDHSGAVKKIEQRIVKLNRQANSSAHQKAEFNIRYSAYTIGETVITADQKKSEKGNFDVLCSSSLIDQGSDYNMSSEETCLFNEKGLTCYMGSVTEQGVETKIHLAKKGAKVLIYISTGDTTRIHKVPVNSFDITSAEFCNKSSLEKFSQNCKLRILDLNSFSVREGSIKIGKSRVRYNRKTYQCRTYSISYDKTNTKVFFDMNNPIKTPLKIEESDKDGKIKSKLTALKINNKIV